MKMTVYPSAQEVGRTYNNKKIAQMGKTQGKELKELGFNLSNEEIRKFKLEISKINLL